jgi:predicted dehydrogenase
VPKYLRAKELMESGGIGRPYLLRQCEKHAGPYSAWFWKANRAGGGITMDMGCHSIECIRWAVGKKKVKSVTAHMGTYLHELNGVSGEPSEVEDFSLIIMEFEDGTLGQAESSWALKGGMDSTLDVFGTGGVIYADMLKGSAIRAFTDMGFPIAPDAGIGWTFHDWDYLWNNGYPQEDAHFLECIRTGATPMESGEDGLAVLEIMLAAYHSAGTGQRVTLPFRPRGLDCPPVDLWRKPRPQLGAGPIR